MMALRNSFTITSDFTNSAYLGVVQSDVAGEDAGVSNNFNSISQYKSMLVPERDMDFSPSVDGANYINDYLSNRIKNKDTTYSTMTITSIFSILTNPFASFKQSLGYDNETEFSVEGLMECAEDASKCAIPMENPLIGISDFGSQLIEVSVTIIVASIAIDYFGSKVSQKFLGDDGALMKKAGSLSSGKGFGLELLTKGASELIDFISLLMSFLVGFAGAILLLGIMLAYVIPLIPFIAFTFAFISWMVFCLQVLFLFPLWCVFSLRVASQQDANTDMYRATYNLIIQILFKPIILVGVYILMWSLLAVMVSVINYTVVTYMLTSLESTDFSLVELTSSIVLLIVYAILIFLVVKMMFKTLHSIVKKIFGYLKVESSQDVGGVSPEDALQKAMVGGIVAGSFSNFGSGARRYANKQRNERIKNNYPVDKDAYEESNEVIGNYRNEKAEYMRIRNKEKNSNNKKDDES